MVVAEQKKHDEESFERTVLDGLEKRMHEHPELRRLLEMEAALPPVSNKEREKGIQNLDRCLKAFDEKGEEGFLKEWDAIQREHLLRLQQLSWIDGLIAGARRRNDLQRAEKLEACSKAFEESGPEGFRREFQRLIRKPNQEKLAKAGIVKVEYPEFTAWEFRSNLESPPEEGLGMPGPEWSGKSILSTPRT
jgi:hypothetical protein